MDRGWKVKLCGLRQCLGSSVWHNPVCNPLHPIRSPRLYCVRVLDLQQDLPSPNSKASCWRGTELVSTECGPGRSWQMWGWAGGSWRGHEARMLASRAGSKIVPQVCCWQQLFRKACWLLSPISQLSAETNGGKPVLSYVCRVSQ